MPCEFGSQLLYTSFQCVGFKWNSGGKGRYTVDSPEAESVGDNDTLPTVPETLSVPMFASAAVPLTGEMLEAARVAAEGNVVDTNAPAQAMAPNALAGLVSSGLVPVPQVPNGFMPFIGSGVPQQQAMGMNQQAHAFNYAQQLNLLRYQQLAQQQQNQQQQNQNNTMSNNGVGNNSGGNPFVNMNQPPPNL